MSERAKQIAANLAAVRERIAEAARHAGRDPAAVRLVAVTKTVGLDDVEILQALGVQHFGENRLEVAAPKIQAFQGDARWHMIGAMQRRKVRDAVPLFDYVDAVDRLRLADELQKRCAENGVTMPVLIEVNVSGEAVKTGVAPEALPAALDAMAGLDRLEVRGLMTMAPFVADPEETRPVFARLRALAQTHGLAEVSMGMTNDYEVAVQEGATEVRIGTALFQ